MKIRSFLLEASCPEGTGVSSMNYIRNVLLGASFAVVTATPAFASDLGGGGGAPTPPASAPITDTVSFEVSPEWGAVSPNTYKDTVLKLGWSHSLGQGWSWGASIAETLRAEALATAYATALETTIGYGVIKLSDMISLPVSAGVGYVWDTKAGPLATLNWGYYVLNAGVNVKFDSHWTWNAVSARYRDAFQGGWVTPKVSTGVTYSIDSHNSIAANIGYSWKNGIADKISGAVSFRYGF